MNTRENQVSGKFPIVQILIAAFVGLLIGFALGKNQSAPSSPDPQIGQIDHPAVPQEPPISFAPYLEEAEDEVVRKMVERAHRDPEWKKRIKEFNPAGFEELQGDLDKKEIELECAHIHREL